MKTYKVDLKFTAWETVLVEADNEEDAQDLAEDKLVFLYKNRPAFDLRNKIIMADYIEEVKGN